MIAAAAPAIPETTPAATPASAASAPGTGFDAILLLQNFAATAETLDAANFEAGDTADLLSEDSSDEDDVGDDLEASLAFLSALLTATTPKGSPGDFQGGAQGQGQSEAGDEANATSGLNALAKAEPLDADTAGKLDAALFAPVTPETLESRGAGDASQNLARAAELLAQAPRPATPASELAVKTQVRDPRWADDFGARVSLMVRGGESTASLSLTPVDMGPVEVNVSVKDSQATIHFGASQADTRAAIEASLPKLRELLASQGFNLTDASVSSGFSRSQRQAFASGNGAGAEAETSTAEARPMRQLGLLDLYA